MPSKVREFGWVFGKAPEYNEDVCDMQEVLFHTERCFMIETRFQDGRYHPRCRLMEYEEAESEYNRLTNERQPVRLVRYSRYMPEGAEWPVVQEIISCNH